MPKRKSANKMKSISNSSISDLTNSELVPIAASSPTEQCEVSTTTNNLNIKELEESIEATRKTLKESVEKMLIERKQELDAIVHEFISKADISTTATVDDIKETQKVLDKFKTNNGNVKNKKNVTKSKIDSTLPAIPEDDLGESFEAGNCKENANPLKEPFEPPANTKGESEQADNFKENENPVKDTIEPPAMNKDKSNKKLTFRDEEKSKFKQPVGRPRKTTKRSYQNINSYQTPNNGTRRGYNVAMVTPGPNSDKPISILRRPNPGEMAISMTGSPLLIAHNNIPVHVPQLSIPLSDGRVMTVMANEGLDPDMSICSDIDSETKERLAVLRELLANKTQKS